MSFREREKGTEEVPERVAAHLRPQSQAQARAFICVFVRLLLY